MRLSYIYNGIDIYERRHLWWKPPYLEITWSFSGIIFCCTNRLYVIFILSYNYVFMVKIFIHVVGGFVGVSDISNTVIPVIKKRWWAYYSDNGNAYELKSLLLYYSEIGPGLLVLKSTWLWVKENEACVPVTGEVGGSHDNTWELLNNWTVSTTCLRPCSLLPQITCTILECTKFVFVYYKLIQQNCAVPVMWLD